MTKCLQVLFKQTRVMQYSHIKDVCIKVEKKEKIYSSNVGEGVFLFRSSYFIVIQALHAGPAILD